ncbi:MAG: ABC transporter ATP-binding protein/permease [Clostridiales bacterium]|nr:ABC transporter ATP-binding protein/permease [Clostridiales bacterium]
MKNKDLYAELKSQFLRGNRANFVLAVIGSFMSGTVCMGVSWGAGELIDTAAGAGTRSIGELAAAALGIIVFLLLSSLISCFSQPRYIRKAMCNYKEKVFSLLTGKNISSFVKESTATYLSALTNDAVSIETNYLDKQFQLITRVVSFFGALTMMLIYSPLLTLIAVAVTILPLLVSIISGGKLASKEVSVSDRNRSFTGTISDCLSGFTVVKSFRAEKEIFDLFAKDNSRLEGEKCAKRTLQIFVGTLGLFAGITAQLSIFFAGTYMAVTGKGITAGTVMIFVNLMNFLIQPVAELPGLLAARKASLALVRRIAECLRKDSFTGGTAELRKLDGAISIKDVSFSYDDDREVLHDISFDFEAGKSYAIVGGSGSGKSTLLNLLLSGAGGSDYKGSIRWDGTELRDCSSDSLFEQVSSIQQNVFVFNSSIRDNITMFRDFSKKDVDAAINRANLSGLIAERGSDYLCGENGSGLSGGEKQRISIARSLLKDSSVLLADEITAALDSQTAHRVSSDILDLTGITRIVVTHSLDESLMRRYDKILVMKDGRIKESGTFDELLAKKDYFHALFTVSV